MDPRNRLAGLLCLNLKLSLTKNSMKCVVFILVATATDFHEFYMHARTLFSVVSGQGRIAKVGFMQQCVCFGHESSLRTESEIRTLFRPSATVSRIGLMESRVRCRHHCRGGPPPG